MARVLTVCAGRHLLENLGESKGAIHVNEFAFNKNCKA